MPFLFWVYRVYPPFTPLLDFYRYSGILGYGWRGGWGLVYKTNTSPLHEYNLRPFLLRSYCSKF